MYTIFAFCKEQILDYKMPLRQGNFLVTTMVRLTDKNNVADREVMEMLQL